MFFWAIIEPCLAVLAVVIVFTQVILPAILDRPSFPLFRRGTRKLNTLALELQEVGVEKDVEKMKATLKVEKENLVRKEDEGEKVNVKV